MQVAFESGWLLHETFKAIAKFTKLRLSGILFCESPEKYVYEFFICICEYTTALSVIVSN